MRKPNPCSCGKTPVINISMGYIFYICCGVMGKFPGDESQDEAVTSWNKQLPKGSGKTKRSVEESLY